VQEEENAIALAVWRKGFVVYWLIPADIVKLSENIMS